MKKSRFNLIVITAAFIIGVAVTWTAFYFISSLRQATSTGDLEVNLKRTYEVGGRYSAEFEIINHSQQDFSFAGYSKTQFCEYNFINVDEFSSARLASEHHWCSCGTGLKKIRLTPGDSTTFDVTLPENPEKYLKVGFDFHTNQDRQITVWSDNISPFKD